MNQSTQSSVASPDRCDGAPRLTTVDDFGFVETDDRFDQGVVIRVAVTVHGGLDPGLGETFGVANREVLTRFKGSSQRYSRSKCR